MWIRIEIGCLPFLRGVGVDNLRLIGWTVFHLGRFYIGYKVYKNG